MSLILDALNRSRGDRDAVPTLESQHFAPVNRSPAGWLWLLPVVLLVLIVVAKFFWPGDQPSWVPPVDRPTDSVPVNQQQALNRAATKSSSVAAPAPQPPSEPIQPAPQARTIPEPAPEVAALYANVEPVADASTAVADPSREAEQSRADDETGGPPVPDTRAVQPNQTTEVPLDVAEVLRQAQQDLGQSTLSSHPVPELSTLSQQAKDRIPTVIYSVHEYGATDGGWVTLNGKRLSVGQRIEGFQVKEILSDSVVLSWGGTDFRLRALNSWINL